VPPFRKGIDELPGVARFLSFDPQSLPLFKQYVVATPRFNLDPLWLSPRFSGLSKPGKARV